MTAVATRPKPFLPNESTQLTGTRTLIRLAARRDRVILVIWLYALTASVASTAYSFRHLYPTSYERARFATGINGNASILAVYGPVYSHSVGGLTAWRIAVVAAVGAALMGIFTVIRHTRADEESGRLELIGSARVGRHAPLLSAIGRIPNTEALTPEAAGIRLNDHGFIEVDEYLETSVPGVYAMGDVTGGPAFTHSSYDDYRILHANLIRHEKASTRNRIVPYTVFIDPQLGRAGMTEREARAQGRAIRVAKLPMSAVIRAIETGETRGFMKAVVDADNGQILGCAVLGSEGGEIMTMIQVAMLGKLTYTDMADAIFTHPLLAEGLNTLFGMFDA